MVSTLVRRREAVSRTLGWPTARETYQDALDAVMAEPAIDFRYNVLLDSSVLVVHATGRAAADASWRVSMAMPEDVGDLVVGGGAADSIRMEVRGVDGHVFMQMLAWPEDMAGCWLQMGPGQVPVGQLALVPDQPGYLTVLDYLRPVGLDAERPDAILYGRLPLRAAVLLVAGQLLQQIDLTEARPADGPVPVKVFLEDGLISGVSVTGDDLADAFAGAGAVVPEQFDQVLRLLDLSVRYASAPAGGDPVVAPADELVVPVDDAASGCRSTT